MGLHVLGKRLCLFDHVDNIHVSGIFQGCFWGRISAPFLMDKGPVFSQSEHNWCTVTVAPTIEHHRGHSRILRIFVDLSFSNFCSRSDAGVLSRDYIPSVS